MNPGELGMNTFELTNLSAPVITTYKTYIREHAKHFCGKSCPNLEADIDAIVKLETELAACKMSIDDSRNPELADVRMSVRRLSELTHFNWDSEVLAPIWKGLGISEPPSPSTYLHLVDVNYFVKAVEVLKRASPRTVHQLLGWRLVEVASRQASEELRLLQYPFYTVRYGLKKMFSRSDSCYYFVNGKLGNPQLSFAVSRLYVDHFFSKVEKAEASVLVDSILASFKRLLVSNTWLDEETKTAALKKISAMGKKVGYAETLLNNTHLDGLHSMDNASFADHLISEKNYLKSLMQMYASMTAMQLKKLNGRGIYLDE